MNNTEDLKKLKFIVFDLDGTLLNYHNEVGEESIKLVDKLENLGMRFTFATGRLYSAVFEHARTMNIRTPLITLDGSYIKNQKTDEIFFESFVPEKYTRKALKLADEYLVQVALCHADAILITEYNTLIPQLLNKFGARYKEVRSYKENIENTLEIVLTSDYKESIKKIEKAMSFPSCFGLRKNFYKTKESGKNYFLEIRKKGASKGTGLKRLKKYLGVSTSETAAIGDWYNDRELFEESGVRVAVANAVPEIKRMADIVTERNNDQDGVAEFLEMVLKAKGG